ncbi:MAG: peptide ABC transporter substrate-binding protein [Gemmatimonadota bacterium]|nr:peptide ABC transporter substrate-binding protein [Gemmatimonadota bacterium]
MPRPSTLPVVFALAFAAPAAPAAQSPSGTLVIAVAREAQSPVPTLWRGDQANREISDLLFLRLASLGPALGTTDDSSFVPQLAHRWKRVDGRTLRFELDPRARWHDGTPVTPRDVVFGFDRARDPKLSPQVALLLQRIESVTATGKDRVTIRFRERYPEQMYDATYHAPPLPAHLLAAMPPDSVAGSEFAAHPVGNGPYTFGRRVAGQSLELLANPTFFLGTPGPARVIFLLAGDAETRANLLLSGKADAVDNIYTLPNPARLERHPDFQYLSVPTLSVGYANLNHRDPSDPSRLHPLFSHPDLRRALVLALNREQIAGSAYGPATRVPSAPVSVVLERAVKAPPPLPFDTAEARRLLARTGWRDTDGDGTIDRGGRPLTFSLMVPAPVAARRLMASQMQEAWRRLGIAVELEVVEPGLYHQRRAEGRYDAEMAGATQDPTPSGLSQSWSCGAIGAGNVARYCNPRFDSLLARAGRSPSDAPALWRRAVAVLAEDVPAIFLAAQVFVVPVHRRFVGVVVRPDSPWADVWRWRLAPGAALPRDRP